MSGSTGTAPHAGRVVAANRVVLVARAIGTRPRRRFAAGRLSRAGCYDDLVTIDRSGLILVRPNARLNLSDLFRA
jgi:hypothetical protein